MTRAHDQAVANFAKIAGRLDGFVDLMGPVIGGMVLAVGIGPTATVDPRAGPSRERSCW
jgi:hypothetical protein